MMALPRLDHLSPPLANTGLSTVGIVIEQVYCQSGGLIPGAASRRHPCSLPQRPFIARIHAAPWRVRRTGP